MQAISQSHAQCAESLFACSPYYDLSQQMLLALPGSLGVTHGRSS